jgi:L-ascorbate metabolism protein UlaG (beta-lactamase superfamily)
MVITKQGESYFRIQNGETVLLIDPTNQRSVRGADIVLNTKINSPTDGEAREDLIIDHPGEYEIRGIRVEGTAVSGEGSTIYRIRWEDLTLGILGPVSKEPEAKSQLGLQGVDVLILPAGGKNLSAAAAAKITRQAEPALVIPWGDLKAFTKEMGADAGNMENKLTFKKKDLSPKAMKIAALAEN